MSAWKLVFVFAAGAALSWGLQQGEAQAQGPQAVCNAFVGVGAIAAPGKTAAWMNEQLAAGRDQFESHKVDDRTTVLCAW